MPELDPGPLVANYETVKALQRSIAAAPRDISTMRMALMQAIADGAWMAFLDPHTGAMYQHKDFRAFIRAPIPEGLQTTEDTMRDFLGEDTPERRQFELVLADAAPLGGHGGKKEQRQVDIINLPSGRTPGGTAVSYLIRRIKRDAPEIAEALGRGEYPSVRAAAIAAGIVRVPTGLDLLCRAWNKASPEEREEFLKRIGSAGC